MSSFQWKAGDRFNRGRAGQCRPVLGQEDSRSTIACCTAEFQPSPEARLCPSWSGRIEARIGLRMMPTFPRSPLSFAE